jgi:hypothetical protein
MRMIPTIQASHNDSRRGVASQKKKEYYPPNHETRMYTPLSLARPLSIKHSRIRIRIPIPPRPSVRSNSTTMYPHIRTIDVLAMPSPRPMRPPRGDANRRRRRRRCRECGRCCRHSSSMIAVHRCSAIYPPPRPPSRRIPTMNRTTGMDGICRGSARTVRSRCSSVALVS